MTELSPDLLRLKAELSRAVRRDHAKRQRRHKLIRTSALGLGVFAALSGSALAAGSALGVINLDGGATATQVSSLPEWNGTTGAFVTTTTDGTAPYAYHISGGTTTLSCPFTARTVAIPNDIYITSTQSLTTSELQQAVTATDDHAVLNASDISVSGSGPGGVTAQANEPGEAARVAANQAAMATLRAEGLQTITTFAKAASCFGPVASSSTDKGRR